MLIEMDKRNSKVGYSSENCAELVYFRLLNQNSFRRNLSTTFYELKIEASYGTER